MRGFREGLLRYGPHLHQPGRPDKQKHPARPKAGHCCLGVGNEHRDDRSFLAADVYGSNPSKYWVMLVRLSSFPHSHPMIPSVKRQKSIERPDLAKGFQAYRALVPGPCLFVLLKKICKPGLWRLGIWGLSTSAQKFWLLGNTDSLCCSSFWDLS